MAADSAQVGCSIVLNDLVAKAFQRPHLQKGDCCDHEGVVDGLGVVLLHMGGRAIEAQHNATLWAAQRSIQEHIIILDLSHLCFQRPTCSCRQPE